MLPWTNGKELSVISGTIMPTNSSLVPAVMDLSINYAEISHGIIPHQWFFFFLNGSSRQD